MIETILKYFERMDGKAISINVEKPFVFGVDIPKLWFGVNAQYMMFEDTQNRTQPFALEIESINNVEFEGGIVKLHGCGYIVTINES